MNLLVISPIGVFDPMVGSQVRIYNLVMQLAKKNSVVVLEPSEFKNESTLLTTYYFNNYYIGDVNLKLFLDFNLNFISKVFNIIRNKKVDFVQVEYLHGCIATKLLIILMGKKIPVICVLHDIESDRVKGVIAKDPRMPLLKRIVVSYYSLFLEKIAVKCADRIIVVSNEDKKRLIEKYDIDEKKVTVIPSGTKVVDLTNLKEKDEVRRKLGIVLSKKIIIFHGAYFPFPNSEAIDLITNYIAPAFMKIDIEVQFVIAGLDVPDIEKGNIKSVGFVDDIYSLIHAADIAIVPILRGGGTRIKILDYMGVGLPIVTTKKGIEGINAKNREHAIIVDGVNEKFIEAMKYLIDNEQERERIGANARRLAEDEYDWDKIGEKLNVLYNNLVKK